MNKLTTSITALALAAGFSFATIAPASADQAAATRNEILGGLALIAGVATAVNVSNKNAKANTVQGYTPNGGTVYQDGHVVLADGQSYYPGNQNQSISCEGGNCSIYGNGNGYNNNNGYGHGRGWRR
jgi:hypothetical protein